MVPLEAMPGAELESNTGSRAYAVSADGSVIVGRAETPDDGDRAFRWTAAEGMISLGVLSETDDRSQAKDVSADGSVVVGVVDRPEGSVAFRWTVEDGMVALDSTSLRFSSAAAVSADGSVVIGTGKFETSDEYVAFIWDDVHGRRTIDSVLTQELGIDLQGWSLGRPRGISSDGLTVVGSGINPSGGEEAWIANLAVPGDADGDGVVDRADVAVLLDNFGTRSGASFSQGDFDHDTAVTLRDLLILKSNLSNDMTASRSASALSVPEPATLNLVILGLIGCAARWRRGRR